MADTFESFTTGARSAFSFAQEEARRFEHNHIGTEHLLLGLVRERQDVATQVLIALGVLPSKVRAAVEYVIQRGEGLTPDAPGLTPREESNRVGDR